MKFYKLWVMDSGLRGGYWLEGGLDKRTASHEAKKLKALGYSVTIFSV